MLKKLQNSKTFNSIIKSDQKEALLRAANEFFTFNSHLGYTEEDLQIINKDLSSIITLANQILAFDHVKEEIISEFAKK